MRIKAVRTDHSWESVLGRFLEYKRAEGLEEQIQRDYTQHVTRFMRRYPGAGAKSDRLAEAAFECLAEDVAPSTYNNRLIYLRTFFSWCVERGIIGSNPITNIKKRKAEPRVVSIDEKIFRELLKLPDQDKYTGLRDYYLILIMLGSGIRPSEAFRLLPVDFMEKAAGIYIPAKIAKARKSRTLHLSDMTVRAIHKLLLARTDDWSPDTPIFCSYEGRQMNRHTVGRPDGIVQRSARRAHTAV